MSKQVVQYTFKLSPLKTIPKMCECEIKDSYHFYEGTIKLQPYRKSECVSLNKGFIDTQFGMILIN